MANAYIREYNYISRDEGGNTIQAGLEDGYRTGQIVSFTASTQSVSFQSDTVMIRISCDVEAFLDFGTNPAAIAADGIQVQADTPEFFGVAAGQKVAIWDGIT